MSRFEQLCNEYRENRRLMEELQAMQDGIRADIIAEMGDNETVTDGNVKASYTTVTSSKFDTAKFKHDFPALYAGYAKQASYKRFNVV